VETLAERFQRYFSVHFATTPEQRNDVYNIRYRVYCDEFGYESAEEFPENLEHDQFDKNSLHCLIKHKGSQRPAGCVRLVTTGDNGLERLPLEAYCADSLDSGFLEGLNLQRTSMCEVSRLAVDGAFRRRASESITRFGDVDAIDCSNHERRTFSLISVAAFLAATSLTELTKRTNVFAMMEPFLPKLLERSGINFRKVGADIDYHGHRAPYFATTEAALISMVPDLRALYESISFDISADFHKSRQ
jgi:N-acyl amino acid synthase of PEP-CTERM/exosortase system